MKYTSFEETIKSSLVLFSKGELENESDFLSDLFGLYPIERMSTLLFSTNDEDRALLINALNGFLEKHYLILDEKRCDFIKSIEAQIQGSPLAIAISILIRKKKEIQSIVNEGIPIKQITLYYNNLIYSLDFLLAKYRGFAQFEITHKNKLDIYDKFTAFLISKRHDLSFFRECNEMEKQVLEMLLDRCSILNDDIPCIARVPFEATQNGKVEIELVPRKEISIALCHYQLDFWSEIELPDLKKSTILDEGFFMEIMYKFFKYINEDIAKENIYIFMQTLKNQMHEKYSSYDRNITRFILNKSIAKYSDANKLFCAIIGSQKEKLIGNKDNFYTVLSVYFQYEIAETQLSKSTIERYLGTQETLEILLRKYGETVKLILND
ncbi:hypothetical protein [Parabacteroides sp. PF5-6]|uniref:hypothetical protein n=1 Tax=Parabacteroides sp. PF5-6 TaxID=1742403 RepID=UPI00240606E6|nr:hypothetical protein [Parabacteroides sp. PF5-6]MDF9829324.1 hypothetical protein [Parabacteroides sp. PF5-6]